MFIGIPMEIVSQYILIVITIILLKGGCIMDNNILSNTYKKVSVNSMLTYFRGLSIENQENVIKWAKASKNPNINVNTTKPSEWEKTMKMIFSQLNPQEQVEAVSKASKILADKKAHK